MHGDDPIIVGRCGAGKKGSSHANRISPRPEEVDSLLDIAFELKPDRGKRGGHRPGARTGCAAASCEYARRASAAGTMRIALLRIGDVAAAMQVAVEEGGRWWLLKIGFDPALAACSPGVLLLAETLRHAVRCDLAGYEFLGTVEPWTRVWTEQERACVPVRVYPFGIGGMAALATDATRALFRPAPKATQQNRTAADAVDATGSTNEPLGVASNEVSTWQLSRHG